jgi:hypothetical protein
MGIGDCAQSPFLKENEINYFEEKKLKIKFKLKHKKFKNYNLNFK